MPLGPPQGLLDLKLRLEEEKGWKTSFPKEGAQDELLFKEQSSITSFHTRFVIRLSEPAGGTGSGACGSEGGGKEPAGPSYTLHSPGMEMPPVDCATYEDLVMEICPDLDASDPDGWLASRLVKAGRSPMEEMLRSDRLVLEDLRQQLKPPGKLWGCNQKGLPYLHIAVGCSPNAAQAVLEFAKRCSSTALQGDGGASCSSRSNQLDVQDYYGNTALHVAAVNGKLQLMELLLNHGGRADLQNKAGETAADYVCTQAANSHAIVALPMLKLLLASGASLHCHDCCGRTCLHRAAASGATDLVSFILSSARQEGSLQLLLTEAHHGGWTAAHDAVELLMEAPLNEEELASQQLHPAPGQPQPPQPLSVQELQEAALRRIDRLLDKVLAVLKLLRAASDECRVQMLEQKDDHGYTLVTWLTDTGVPAASDATGIGRAILLHLAHKRRLFRLLKRELGMDLDVRDSRQQTPLMHAAAEGNSAFVEALLREGVQHRAKDADGRTAAAIAVEKRHADLLRLLVAADSTNPAAGRRQLPPELPDAGGTAGPSTQGAASRGKGGAAPTTPAARTPEPEVAAAPGPRKRPRPSPARTSPQPPAKRPQNGPARGEAAAAPPARAQQQPPEPACRRAAAAEKSARHGAAAAAGELSGGEGEAAAGQLEGEDLDAYFTQLLVDLEAALTRAQRAEAALLDERERSSRLEAALREERERGRRLAEEQVLAGRSAELRIAQEAAHGAALAQEVVALRKEVKMLRQELPEVLAISLPAGGTSPVAASFLQQQQQQQR